MSGIITAADGSTLQFDVVLTEQYNPKNNVTDVPIEDGSNYSDHIQRQPVTFTIVAILSENPFKDTPISPTRLTDAIVFLKNAGYGIVSYTSTRFGIIPNLAMESWSFTNDVFDRLEFIIGFKRIHIAEAQIVTIPRPQQQAATPIRPCGEQPAEKEIPAEVVAKPPETPKKAVQTSVIGKMFSLKQR